MIRPLLRSAAAVFLCTATLLHADSVEEVLTRARAWIGSDSAINAIQSVCYQGTLTTDTGMKASIEIILQKPYQQRVTLATPERVEITALDGYDAWQRMQDPKDPSRWNMRMLTGRDLKRLRANTFDILNFFRADTFTFGKIIDKGNIELDGVACRQLVFQHNNGVEFTRLFDAKTGRLVRSETEDGGVMIESGEFMVNGLRFPKRLSNSARAADGQLHPVIIEFDKILVNETYATSLFAVPIGVAN